MSLAPTTWPEALDLLEREIAAIEGALASGAPGVEFGDVSLPGHLGPLPADLRSRAVEIHRRQQQAELELSLAVQRARQALAFGDLSPAAGPSLIDRRH